MELKSENDQILSEKMSLQKEIQSSTDYIVQLEEKCYQANKTCTDLLTYMRALETDYKNQVEVQQ